MKQLKLLSPAKVNLFLKVVGKRADGYHDIVSLMQPVMLYDKITIKVDEGDFISATCDNPLVPQGEENLAQKAAKVFLEVCGLKKKVSIEIKKIIPVGGGLGGGSSDAASVLMGLNDIFSAPLSENRLMEIALRIGSDVPFFMLKSAAIARGRGEILERVKLPLFHYILVSPGFSISTKWVYDNLCLTKASENNIFKCLKESISKDGRILEILENDLEEPVFRRYNEVQELKELLKDAGAKNALMSGSGSIVFGVFLNEFERDSVYSRLKGELKPHFTVYKADSL